MMIIEKEILRMKFVFDSERLEANGMTEEQCLNIIRNYTLKHNLTEISKGIFDSRDLNNMEPFIYMIMNLPYSDWFLKVIKKWYWYVEEGIEDCLKSFYKAAVRHAENYFEAKKYIIEYSEIVNLVVCEGIIQKKQDVPQGSASISLIEFSASKALADMFIDYAERQKIEILKYNKAVNMYNNFCSGDQLEINVNKKWILVQIVLNSSGWYLVDKNGFAMNCKDAEGAEIIVIE